MTPDHIIKTICQYYGYTEKELYSTQRKVHLAHARQVCHYMLREHTEMSYPIIGRLMRRDHSSIWHNHRAVQKRLDEFETYRDVKIIADLLGKPLEIKTGIWYG